MLGKLRVLYDEDSKNLAALCGISQIYFHFSSFVPGIDYHQELRQKISPFVPGNHIFEELYTTATIRIAVTYQKYKKSDQAFELLSKSLDQKFCASKIVKALESLKVF